MLLTPSVSIIYNSIDIFTIIWDFRGLGLETLRRSNIFIIVGEEGNGRRISKEEKARAIFGGTNEKKILWINDCGVKKKSNRID